MEEYKKILRAPSLKRGKTEERITDRIKLEKVLGVTVASNAALASDDNGTIAYPAGCTVVLFDTKSEQQHHIINTTRKTITSLAFSSCGRYIATGECGHQPAIRVWDLFADLGPQSQPPQIAEFLGHKYGISCVAFSPSGKFVVSVGTQHDMIVNVWEWRTNTKIASNKVSTKVKSIAFAENGSYFVTVGNRHVKFWYLEYGGEKNKFKEAVPLMGRSAILGEQRNNYFCDVACGRGQSADSTFVITRSGLLCEFNNRRLLDKWVELRTTSANCITIGERFIFVGCAEGIVRVFEPNTLRFITTMPRTHYLGVDVSLGTSIGHMSQRPNAKYPDTIALTYNEKSHKLTSIYNDHSIYVWDVFNINRVGKSFSFLYHSACIWGVEMPPANSPLPSGSFLTCSSDDTIRVWSLDQTDANSTYPKNVYSNELLKVIYVDAELNYIKDLDISVGANGEKVEMSYDSRNGVRCIRMSPDGLNLASGDRSGNIRIYDTRTMAELYKIEAHDSEVLCLEYSSLNSKNELMASASRDRLLHVFNVKTGYQFLQTLDDHSSSITAVRFLPQTNGLEMISCGADKSLIFRKLTSDNQFVRGHNATGKTTLYDMEIDTGGKHVLTACQDRNVRVYNCQTGKHTKSFKGSTGDDGTLIKVVLDRSGIYLATSCTDKSLTVYDYYSGECMATMCGHSELATGLRFTNDCKRLISASGDGCIFVWKVPHDMVVTMHARLSQQAMRLGKTHDSELLIEPTPIEQSYRFSIGQLPHWAKKQLSEEATNTTTPINDKMVVAPPPKGRWAQRAEDNLKSFYETTTTQNLTLKRGDTEFDADIDSDSESRPIYYPNQAESPNHEFIITNMDQDELRKSQRKKKPPILVMPTNHQAPFSQESDDEDDEVSTPSGENTDRNPMSLFSISSESLDQLVNREKYLQSTFESMSGAETEIRVESGVNTSISSKFRTTDVNLAAIQAVKQTKSDPEALKIRLMLNQRIAETKKKLESVGHTSPLKYSQSIHDLSYIPEQDKYSQASNKDESSPDDSSLRRSCSLSDLRMQKPVSKKIEVSGKKSTNVKLPRSQSSRYLKNNTNLQRSKSSIVLNHSDSDTETTEKKQVSRLMRPTISSHNKITQSNNKNFQMRKSRSYSTSNLNQVGTIESTTDEDIGEQQIEKIKPIAPPRHRQYETNNIHAPNVAPRRLLNNKEKMTKSNKESGVSEQLCDEVIDELIVAADNVVGLYNSLTDTNSRLFQKPNRMEMVKKLELSIFNTHKVLHDAIFQKLKQTNGNVDVNQTDTVKKLNDLVAKGPSGPNSVVNMMEQYSDILLDMVQQKMHNSSI